MTCDAIITLSVMQCGEKIKWILRQLRAIIPSSFIYYYNQRTLRHGLTTVITLDSGRATALQSTDSQHQCRGIDAEKNRTVGYYAKALLSLLSRPENRKSAPM